MLDACSRIGAGSIIGRSSGLKGDICRRLRSSMDISRDDASMAHNARQ